MHLVGRKQSSTWYQVWSSAHGSIIPEREGNGTNELWYTVPYHLQPNNTRNTPIVLFVHSKKRKRKGKNKHTNTHEEERKEERKGKTKQKTNQTCALSPEDKVAVCWYDQSYDTSS